MKTDKKTVARTGIVLAVAAAAGLFFYLDLGRYLDLAYVKASRQALLAYYQGHRAVFVLSFCAVYIVVTALSLPGAAVLTLAGGAVMGFWTGLIAVSFASTIGATLACAVARFLLRDWVEARFGERLEAIYQGVEKEGVFYLFSLRLVPVFPFFLINIAMGLTPMRLATFYWVSQLGMLPGTAVYVNAGRELGRIDSLSGILSPGLVLSFALLGLFPLAAKKIMAFIRSNR